MDAAARGDAEVVTGWPFKLAVAVNGLAPSLMIDTWALVNKYLLPDPGGVGPVPVKGAASRGRMPSAVTTLSDRAADANNERVGLPPPLPTS